LAVAALLMEITAVTLYWALLPQPGVAQENIAVRQIAVDLVGVVVAKQEHLPGDLELLVKDMQAVMVVKGVL